jgi:hypothetical protein
MLEAKIWLSYLLGLFVTHHLILAWVVTNFPQHVWNLLHRKEDPIYTRDDLVLAAVGRYGGWGDLWTCPLCSGTWIGAMVASAFLLTFSLPWWFIPIGAFTWAGIVYRINHRLLK